MSAVILSLPWYASVESTETTFTFIFQAQTFLSRLCSTIRHWRHTLSSTGTLKSSEPRKSHQHSHAVTVSWTHWRKVGFKKSAKRLYLYQLHATVILQEPQGCRLAKKFTAFYGSRRSITVFTGACHLSLAWARWNQSTSSHPVSLHSQPWLVLPSGLCPLGLPTKPGTHLSCLYTCYMPRPSHPLWFDYPHNI
jgi:hypothetical protein